MLTAGHNPTSLIIVNETKPRKTILMAEHRVSPVVSQPKLINNCSNLQAHEVAFSEINKCPQRSDNKCLEALIFWERMERAEGQKELLSEATFLTNLFRISSSHTCEK